MDRILLRTIQPSELWWQCSSRLQSATRRRSTAIFCEEVEIAVVSLKKGKSEGVDKISAELVQAGRETMTDVLTEIRNRIWRTGERHTLWTQSLIIHSLKRATYSSARTTELPASSVMMKAILNMLKPQAEEIIAEEQAGFKAGRSTTEQIFNLRLLCGKYLQHQQNLYHIFIDFKKAFDPTYFWYRMACSLMGDHAEVQYQCKSSLHHWATLC